MPPRVGTTDLETIGNLMSCINKISTGKLGRLETTATQASIYTDTRTFHSRISPTLFSPSRPRYRYYSTGVLSRFVSSLDSWTVLYVCEEGVTLFCFVWQLPLSKQHTHTKKNRNVMREFIAAQIEEHGSLRKALKAYEESSGKEGVNFISSPPLSPP